MHSRIAEAAAAAIAGNGSELVFGVPGGGPNLDLIGALEHHEQPRPELGRLEMPADPRPQLEQPSLCRAESLQILVLAETCGEIEIAESSHVGYTVVVDVAVASASTMRSI